MPIRLVDLKFQRRKLTIPVTFSGDDGSVTEDLTIIYNPGSVTDEFQGRVRESIENQDEGFLNHVLAATLVEWDLIDDAGEMIPFAENGEPSDVLRELPIMFKGDVVTAILSDFQGNPTKTKSDSADGSPQKAK